MNTAITERVLVERCKAGDHAAFEALIRQSSATARRAIRTIARNPADVDDLMQDTVMKAFQALRSFDQRSSFSTWLTRIAINNALMLLRRQKNKRETNLGRNGEKSDITSFPIADGTLNPEQVLLRNESIEIVKKAIHTLPLALREYAEQRCFKELSNREVSSSLRITLGAGKSRYHRVRRRLRLRIRSNHMQLFSPLD